MIKNREKKLTIENNYLLFEMGVFRNFATFLNQNIFNQIFKVTKFPKKK